ncbi:MAG: N-acetylglucosamine-6-phosphate deacetylase [Clostridia bacterium]|nr:N-acetylglucosamine-6-phosphate deacetylase [Clostridia bacterium]
MIVFKNVRPIINGKISNTTNIAVENDKISQISAEINDKNADIVYDLKGGILAAGYIDIHTHGGGGHDMMEGTEQALDEISKYHLITGSTTYLPTTLTADIPTTLEALDNVRKYKSPYARIYGTHLEGPFISMKAPGAHPPAYILEPNAKNTGWVWDNKDVVSRITIAPDQASSEWFTNECTKNNIQISLGHDASIDDEINALTDKGASSVTHMYNCTSRCSRRTTPHKHLGLTEVGLTDDRLYNEVIADNRHVPNPLFKMIYKLKGADKICLVSDSLAIAGNHGGEFYLGSGVSKQRIVIEEDVAIIKELNTYAGSVTPISKMVANLCQNLNIPLEECVKMGSLNQAKLMGMTDRGDIKVGLLADFNLLDEKGNLLKTYLGGKEVK